ncbi:hypothetical protein JQS43_09625 [Natronosporangium hydrolyticum]|uniref:Guanylate cyclase domain-containing protein n=1 Tax=Natronosporangium hydrolyticum TaxID=2811111 RepID=A0A895YKJ0_9ACTN|nr:hypothetical protein [Natronosporangium hydrolyticum]QSB16505.1 hypothetical protein JQS43_09625 [Natronosporangium hydrolyticum]
MATELPPFSGARDLPDYLGILAVDAKDFTAEPSVAHQPISGLIPRLTGTAFENIGLAEVWNQPAFFGPTGDGFAVGVPPRALPYLVDPLLAELQQVLAAHNSGSRRAEALLRLRVSLHVGPLPADPAQPFTGGGGTPRNDTHRLLDSTPVRAILSAASPRVTFVAAILSDRIFQDVVAAGYTSLHPDHFIEVPATVPGKGFTQRAWLRVPAPSGNLLTVGSPAVAPEPCAPPPAADPGAPEQPVATPEGAVQSGSNYGQVAGVVHGGMSMHRPETGSHR